MTDSAAAESRSQRKGVDSWPTVSKVRNMWRDGQGTQTQNRVRDSRARRRSGFPGAGCDTLMSSSRNLKGKMLEGVSAAPNSKGKEELSSQGGEMYTPAFPTVGFQGKMMTCLMTPTDTGTMTLDLGSGAQEG